ncbi:MAG: SprT family zinc-dependent metalloprotease [Gammaproteobacteria bacterium]|jgi:hypothetical protein
MADLSKSIKIDHIIRSRRRSVALIIRPDATLELRIPRLYPLALVKKFVEKKHKWILSKQNLVHQKNTQMKALDFKTGSTFRLLGAEHVLEIGKYKHIFLADKLYFPEKFLPNAKHHITHWYKQEAKLIIRARVLYFAELTNLHPKKITITSAKKRWGSCSGKNNLCFSWRLILAPLEIVDYVVAHEMSHILEKNHSKHFWQKVQNIMPDYKKKRLWLKKNSNSLTLL